MDTLDFRILTSLDADARRSYADLARELEVSQPTIADRVRRLETRGILRGAMLCLDHARLGYGVGAFVRIRSNSPSKRPLIDAANKISLDNVFLKFVAGTLLILAGVETYPHTVLVNRVFKTFDLLTLQQCLRLYLFSNRLGRNGLVREKNDY